MYTEAYLYEQLHLEEKLLLTSKFPLLFLSVGWVGVLVLNKAFNLDDVQLVAELCNINQQQNRYISLMKAGFLGNFIELMA